MDFREILKIQDTGQEAIKTEVLSDEVSAYKCEVCNLKFETNPELKNHKIQEEHNLLNEVPFNRDPLGFDVEIKDEPEELFVSFNCIQCGREFQSQSEFNDHQLKHVLTGSESSDSEDKAAIEDSRNSPSEEEDDEVPGKTRNSTKNAVKPTR